MNKYNKICDNIKKKLNSKIMEVLKLMMNHSDLLSRPYSPDLRVPAINLENFPQFLICKN